MTLKPVAFKKDIQHTNLSVQTTARNSNPKVPTKFIKNMPKIKFSDSESDNGDDNPIPFLKKSSSSEYFSDEDHDIDIKPTQIRKGLRRPMPLNRGNRKVPLIQRDGNTNVRKETTATAVNKQKFLPHPPSNMNQKNSPPNETANKKVSPMFFRRIRKNGDENVNNWSTPQKQISLVKPKKIEQDTSYSYSEDEEQSYNTSSDNYYSDDDDDKNLSHPNEQTTQTTENCDLPNLQETETNNQEPEKNENENDQIQKQINDKINNILSQNTENETDKNDQTPSSPAITNEEKTIEEEQPYSICYFMDRKIVSKFTKNKLCMTLTKGCNTVISQVFDIHDESFKITYKDQSYTILMESSQCSFSLRKGESYGDEVFSVLYNTTKNAVKPKNCVLRFFVKVQGLPNRLQSVQPSPNAEGEAKISFDHRQVIPSIKNMKFLDENQKEILAVMKIGKDQICIEALSIFPEEIIFVIGVAAFLNHSK